MTAALFPARSASGILQHHDAITGTATQAVMDDYERMLVQGTQAAGQVWWWGFKDVTHQHGLTLLVRNHCHLCHTSLVA